MKFALLALLVAVVLVGVALGESGSWCYKPSREAFWGAASAACCNGKGSIHDDRRCYGLQGNPSQCRAFYQCCISQFGSGNKPSDGCN